jgi:hypothetical protein
MTRSLAVAVGVLALAAPSAAAAPSLEVVPQKRCYSAGESVNLLGAGFTPSGSAGITREDTLLGALNTDAGGAFNGVLTLAQDSGRATKTYTATDRANPTLTASAQITVSAVRVDITPEEGSPGRLMTIRARGFTTGRTLWAHIIRGGSKRHVKLGALKGACGNLEARRRLLPRRAALGVHAIQFDTFRRYRKNRAVRDRYTITVSGG